jgi:hypothetical protein
MSNNKQSSVEWLFPQVLELTLQLSNKRISQRGCELKILELFEQAKAMHEEEIIISNMNGQAEYDQLGYRDIVKDVAEQYYNETFKTQEK